MSQFLRPSANVTQTSFTGGYAEIGEATANDVNFAWGANNTAAVLEVALSDPTGTPGGGTTTFRYRIARTNAGFLDSAGNAVTVTAAVYQGATLIASDTAKTATGTWTQYSFTPNMAAVTDWTDVRLRFTTSASGGTAANRRGAAISWAEMEVPDAAAVVGLTVASVSQGAASSTDAITVGAPPGAPASAIAAFTLKAPASQAAAPFCIGHAFRKGDVPAGSYVITDLAQSAVVPLRTWNDGSLKHAAIIGRAPLTANVARQVNLSVTTTAPAGTNLTAADIAAAGPTASVQCGALGTVSLASLLATPARTFLSTPEMVECHYTAAVGSDASLYVWFHVRLFADGRLWVRAIVGNGYLEQASASHSAEVRKDYVPIVIIGGATVWDNGGATYKHYAKTRWDITGWIGGDPQVTPRHDTGYLNRTKLIPNFWKNNPSQATIDAWAAPTITVNVSGNYAFDAVTTYTPGENMAYTPPMGQSGFQDMIGLLPTWEALYCTSGAQATMYRVVLDHARAINSFAIAYVDQASRNPVKLSSYATWSAEGAGGAGGSTMSSMRQDGTDTLTWEAAHTPSFGYLAYLLTADYYYLETLQFGATMHYLVTTSGAGSGVNRDLGGQVRARGWGYRTLAQAAAIYPSSLSALYGDTASWLANLMTARKAKYVTNPAASAWLGYEDAYSNRLDTGVAPDGQLCLQVAPWEYHFVAQAMGMAYDIEPVGTTAMADLATFRDYAQSAPVWILGGTGSTEFNFGYASSYVVNIRADIASSTWAPPDHTHLIPTDGGQIYSDTFATTATPLTNPGTNTLMGDSGGAPTGAKGYWGNLLPALAYAVDHGKAGALAGWNRLKGASNWSSQDVTADYANNSPQWGVVPRADSQPALLFTPVAPTGAAMLTLTAAGVTQAPACSTAAVTTAAPGAPASYASTRVDSARLITGALVVGNRGLGVLGSAVPSTGFSGPGYLYNDLSLPGDANREVRGVIESWPAAGTLRVNEDSSFTFAAPDGTYSFQYRLYVEGADQGTATVTLTIGQRALVVAPSSQSATSSGAAITRGVTLAAAACSQSSASAVAAVLHGATLSAAPCAQSSTSANVQLLRTLTLTAASCTQGALSSPAPSVMEPAMPAAQTFAASSGGPDAAAPRRSPTHSARYLDTMEVRREFEQMVARRESYRKPEPKPAPVVVPPPPPPPAGSLLDAAPRPELALLARLQEQARQRRNAALLARISGEAPPPQHAPAVAALLKRLG